MKFDAGDLSSERLIAEPGKSKLSQCLNDVSGKEIVFSISEAATNDEFESGTIDLRELIKAEIDEED